MQEVAVYFKLIVHHVVWYRVTKELLVSDLLNQKEKGQLFSQVMKSHLPFVDLDSIIVLIRMIRDGFRIMIHFMNCGKV